MQIILSRQCESLTGYLGQGFGYHIQRRSEHNGKVSFWGVRKSKGAVPNNGHWRFILACANLAQNKLHIADVKVTNRELYEALREANLPTPAFLNWNNVEIYNASDILNFKNKYNL